MSFDLQLKKVYSVSERVYLYFTTTPFENMYNTVNYRMALSAISNFNNLLISRYTDNKNGGNKYRIITSYGEFTCVDSDNNNGAWAIIGYSQSDFRSKNNAIKYGITFKVTNGICISVANRSYEIYCEFINGKEYSNTDHSKYAIGNFSPIINNAFDIENSLTAQKRINNTQPRSDDEVFVPSEGLDEKLKLSENYSQIASELEANRVNASGRVYYSEIRALNYDRADRLAYRFIVGDFNKNIFKKGVQVEFTDLQENKVNAEIISAAKDESGAECIDLLFNIQFDIKTLNSCGIISLSYSNMTFKVQMAANNRIREGTAASQYIDDILGRHTPAGFDNIDLAFLHNHYNDKSFYKCPPYPPNSSQQQAIFNGISSKDIYLVMGPPGTGKTSVILEWVKYFILHNKMRVLISSQNNKAVDNVIERIMNEDGIDVLRIGSEEKLQENVKQCMFENKISTLRSDISSSINNAVNSANIASDVCNDVDGCARKYIALKKDSTDKQSLLNTAIDNLLISYNKCFELSEKAAQKKAQLTALFNSTNTRYEKNAKHKSKTSNFFSFYTRIAIFVNGLVLKKKVARLSAVKNEYLFVCSEYETKASECHYCLNSILTSEFTQFELSLIPLEACRSQLAAKTKQTDPLGIFTSKDYTEEDLKKSDAEADILFRAQNGHFRAEELKKVLADWKTEIEDTQNYALNDIVMQRVNLVGATCIGINTQKRFVGQHFDVTIIDEAGQIQIHNALVPMSVSNKLIMLGDHKQIPPITDEEMINTCIDREVSTQLLEKSLFEVMYNSLPESNKSMLDTQFRMPAEIADIISEWFYAGRYKSAEFKQNLPSILPAISSKPFIIIDTADSKYRYEKSEEDGGQIVRYNVFESEIIVKLCLYLKSIDYDFSEIGIICGLKRQVQQIKSQLVRAGFTQKTADEITATLDSFQGQERDIIIYSFTRSSSKNTDYNRVGFLTELRRLNVAMSRCKKAMVMTGDIKYLSECESTKNFRGEILDDDKTEKNFSAFIRKMVADIKEKNRGEIITSAEYENRLKKAGIQ